MPPVPAIRSKTAKAGLSTDWTGGNGPVRRLASGALRLPDLALARREFRDFFRKTVEALQSFVFFLDVAAIHDAVHRRRFRLRLRRDRRVITVEPLLAFIVDVEAGQQLLGERFRRAALRCLRLGMRGRLPRGCGGRRVVLLRQGSRCVKYDDQRKQSLHVLSSLALDPLMARFGSAIRKRLAGRGGGMSDLIRDVGL